MSGNREKQFPRAKSNIVFNIASSDSTVRAIQTEMSKYTLEKIGTIK